MKNEKKTPAQSGLLTIPNLLSCLRLGLIPVFVWTYCVRRDEMLTALLLLLSGATDIADGLIARKFHMVSDLGKVLDPVADKLTQTAMLVCLLTRFPMMALPLALLVLKELYMAASGLLIIRRTGVVLWADWHGKAATVLLYAVMLLHVVWGDVPAPLSNGALLCCAGMILLSFLLYAVRNTRTLREEKARKGQNQET